jgi:hypothetical protein
MSNGNIRLLFPSKLPWLQSKTLEWQQTIAPGPPQEPILRFLNLQLQRQRCSRLESF